MRKDLAFFIPLLLLLAVISSQPINAEGTISLILLFSGGEPVIIDPEGIITEDTTIVVDEGSSALLTNLTVEGTTNSTPYIMIIVNGELLIKGEIACTHANLTIQNNGKLAMQGSQINQAGNGTLLISSAGVWIVGNTSINTYGGHTKLESNGSFSANDFRLKDQYDGTSFINRGNASLSNSSFTANGALGFFWITNYGNMEFYLSALNANYGGTIEINSMSGYLSFNCSSIYAQGWSHGRQSSIRIISANATWINCTSDGYSGATVYTNYGSSSFVNCNISYQGNWLSSGNFTMIGCRVHNISNLGNTGNMSMTNCNISDIHNLSNQGSMMFILTSLGATNIANLGLINLTESSFDCCKSMSLLNTGEIHGERWKLRTVCTNATIIMSNKGNITFTQPFVEGISSQDLTSITKDGKNIQGGAGTIRITNEGIIRSTSVPVAAGMTFYQLLAVMAVAVAALFVVGILVIRKKQI